MWHEFLYQQHVDAKSSLFLTVSDVCLLLKWTLSVCSWTMFWSHDMATVSNSTRTLTKGLLIPYCPLLFFVSVQRECTMDCFPPPSSVVRGYMALVGRKSHVSWKGMVPYYCILTSGIFCPVETSRGLHEGRPDTGSGDVIQ